MINGSEFPSMHHAPVTHLSPTLSSYVVTVPHKGSERVAYGLTVSLSKRAATRLAKAIQPLYKGKLRAVMLKTALKAQ